MPDISAISPTGAGQAAANPGAETPSIAVVIAARNEEEFLPDALDSIVHQSCPPHEVVLFDDGSTDRTRHIAESFQSKLDRFTILSSDEPVGISAARNRANEVVTSDFIAVLDADDLLDSKALELYLGGLATNPDTDLLYGDTCVFSAFPETGKLLCYPRFQTARAAIRQILASPRVPMKHSSVIYRKEAFDRLEGYDESRRIKVDVDLFLRFFQERCSVRKLDHQISFHRKHGAQISTHRIEGIRAYADLAKRYEPNLLVRPLLLISRSFAEIIKLILRG